MTKALSTRPSAVYHREYRKIRAGYFKEKNRKAYEKRRENPLYMQDMTTRSTKWYKDNRERHNKNCRERYWVIKKDPARWKKYQEMQRKKYLNKKS